MPNPHQMWVRHFFNTLRYTRIIFCVVGASTKLQIHIHMTPTCHDLKNRYKLILSTPLRHNIALKYHDHRNKQYNFKTNRNCFSFKGTKLHY